MTSTEGDVHNSYHYDYDYVVVGSGFGGSVSAMRLAQKGYRVCVLEVGRRYAPEDLPKTNWNLFRSLWAPALRMFGIWRVSVLRHIAILGASAVGGGSINYGNTLYVPPQKFFDNERVKEADRVRPLLPYYELAKKMLGAVENPVTTAIDTHLKATAAEMGRGHTYRPTQVAVYFGKQKETAPDPFFLGEGPDRTGCELCGGCMVGCRYNSKNTLDKNYLYFAEKLGAVVIPEHKVVKVRPLGHDGSRGYEIEAVRVTGFPRKSKKRIFTRGVVFSAGVLGTVDLLLKMKQRGILPNLSDAIGKRVCTNSEALVGVRSNDPGVDFSHGVAITSSIFPDDTTHIEPCRFSKGSDLFGLAPVVLTDGGALPRPLQFLVNCLRHPIQALRWRNPFGFARRSVYLLVMQTLDSHIGLARKRRVWWPFRASLTTIKEKGSSIPVYIPVAHEFARRLARRIGGMAGNNINEVLLGMSTTAHILGGCNMGSSPETAVIDLDNRVFGYKNMLVCDGSMIPVNLGVNPSLSITAFSERALSFIPPKEPQSVRPLKVEEAWGVAELVGAQQAS